MAGTNRASFSALREHLSRIGSAADRKARHAAFADLAQAAESQNAVVPLFERLLRGGTNGQRFALEVTSRLTRPIPVDLHASLAALVDRGRFPTRLRVDVAGAIIRSINPNSPLIPRLFEALTRQVSSSRATNRLRRLAILCPGVPAIAVAISDLASGALAPCPRCAVRLAPDALVAHLWEKHRLLMENGRAREPWDVVGDLVHQHRMLGDIEYLDRACDLAQALDAAEGLTRVHRLLVTGGTGDGEAHAILRADAAQKHASLCPHCFALVKAPAPAAIESVLVGPGRVDGNGYLVEITEKYLFNELFVESPDGRIFVGPEPGHALTRRGATFIFTAPLMMIATMFALLPPLLGVPPILPVAGLLLAVLVAYLSVRAVWADLGDPTDRAVDQAWEQLVPALCQRRQLSRADAAFIAGLASATAKHGDVAVREEPLKRAMEVMLEDRQTRPYLTALRSLRLADGIGAGDDDVPAIAEEVGAAFDARVPLDHAETIIRDHRGEARQVVRRSRLRVLILTKAFEAELEAGDLRTIGRVCPLLGAAFASEDKDGVARLRLLWHYRPRRLWQRVGPATAVFDLARYPALAEIYLKQRPDLLLFQASTGSDGSPPILICEQGVVFQELVLTQDVPIRVKGRRGSYELVLGDRSIPFAKDPTELSKRLRAWVEFLFDEFLPRARTLTRRRSAQGEKLLSQKLVTCSECKTPFHALAGEVGFEATIAKEAG